jgi:hypothetical protein
MESQAPAWITLDGAVNARAVVPGALLRADNLQSLSDQDVQQLVERERVEVILDLRTDIEITLEGPGPMTREERVRIEYRSLYPDSGRTDIDAETIRPWWRARGGSDDEPPVVRAYLSYLNQRPDSIVGSVRTIARADGAVLVHCAAGKDRTGVVVAVALDAAGIEHDEIVQDYLVTADRIEEIAARLSRSPTYADEMSGRDPRELAPVPGTMERFLELVGEHHGGSAAWLSGNGMSGDDLELLRRRLASNPGDGQ